jgi:4-hydroxybenzoate polyprenyltransferase
MLSLAKWNAYYRLTRLDKPIGIWLLMWPTLWGLLIAGQGKPDLHVVLVFVLGTILMRSAGCALNDIADRHWDGAVARTRLRPLATGEISVKEAYLVAMFLALVSAGIISRHQLSLYQTFFSHSASLSGSGIWFWYSHDFCCHTRAGA